VGLRRERTPVTDDETANTRFGSMNNVMTAVAPAARARFSSYSSSVRPFRFD